MAVDEVITMTADLLSGQSSRLRQAPSLSASIITTLTGPLHVEAKGEKILAEGYYWSELVYPQRGWIAWTTSYGNHQQWGGTGGGTNPSKVIGVLVTNPEGVILKHEDGTETPLP